MTAYIIVALEKFGLDWEIYHNVFINKKKAENECAKLNNKISGYVYVIEERELI